MLLGQVVLRIVTGMTPLLLAYLVKSIFDALDNSVALGVEAAPPVVWILVALQVGVLAAARLSTAAAEYLDKEHGRHLQLLVQTRIYRAVSGVDGLGPLEDNQFQDNLQLGLRGAHAGARNALSTGVGAIQSALSVAVLGLVLLRLGMPVVLLALVVSIPHLVVEARIAAARFRTTLSMSTRERLALYYGALLTQLSFAKELRLFDLGPYFRERFESVSLEIAAAYRKQDLRTLGWEAGFAVLSPLTTAVVSITVIRGLFTRVFTLGDLMLYGSAAVGLQAALTHLTRACAAMNEAALFFERYQQVLGLPASLVTFPTTRRVPPLEHAIEFQDVAFRYSGRSAWVLHDLNLVIPARRCLALVGVNGAGKSTVAKLLARLYDPTHGRILWDGVDLRAFDPSELRRQISAFTQDFVRYELSARENIALGDITERDNEEAILRAASFAGAEDLIDHLPQGLDTLLSRSMSSDGTGVDLSGGEWQKVALSRMLMRDAQLRILDEPTASLDAAAERYLFDRFGLLVRGATSLLISHRFGSVRMADEIAVIADGRIAEHGRHTDLVAGEGTYAHLYRAQAAQYG